MTSEALELFRRTCEVRRDIARQYAETGVLLDTLLSTMSDEEINEARKIYYEE